MIVVSPNGRNGHHAAPSAPVPAPSAPDWLEWTKPWTYSVRAWCTQHPEASLAVALVFGIALGCKLKRR
jgi:hypothetical protein